MFSKLKNKINEEMNKPVSESGEIKFSIFVTLLIFTSFLGILGLVLTFDYLDYIIR